MLLRTLFATVATVLQMAASMTLSKDVTGGKLLHRERRLLVFPTGTVMQATLGVSTPVYAPDRTVLLSLGFQLVFGLPTNATLWHTPPDIMSKREISNRALRNTYLPLESFLEKYGFDGRKCVLRSICEAAHSPFQHEEMDLLEEVVHSVLTPSQEVPPEEAFCNDSTGILDSLPLEKQYLAAECLGKSAGDCLTAYPECPHSPPTCSLLRAPNNKTSVSASVVKSTKINLSMLCLKDTVFIAALLSCYLPADAERKPRALVYPKGGVCKFIVGIGIPVDLPKRILTLGLNFQFQYTLPTNVTLLKQYPEIQSRTLREAVNRGTTYQALQTVMERHGIDGRSCLLRTICEVAETPLHHNGLVGELLHVMLTPGYGSNMDEIIDADYHEARRLGEEGGDCHDAYPMCPFGHGLLDLISMIDT